MSKIILVRGKAGVGKTTISNELSKSLNVPVIRKDDIYDELSELGLAHEKINHLSEKVLLAIVKTNIQNVTDLIIDSSYHYPSHYEKFVKWIQEQGVSLKSILVTCSNEELWKSRFEERKINPKPNNKIVDFENLKKHYGTLEVNSYEGELVLDSAKDLKLNVKKILKKLRGCFKT